MKLYNTYIYIYIYNTSIALNKDVLIPTRGDIACLYNLDDIDPLVLVVRGKYESICKDDLRDKCDELGDTGLIICPKCSCD